jgi:serine/threonine-protein kinase PknG
VGIKARWSGIIDLPPPPADPAGTVLANPTVAETRRFCSRCQLAVGRARDGAPGRTEGYCPRDGTPFSFTPKLAAGDRINQFEVVGCLAHGGVGWIYLARDLNLESSWRVLKGLRDSGDAGAWEAVVAERRFLAQVDHPNIVKIYDFVQHTNPVTANVAGYLVMEYVGGQSLQQILAAHRDDDGTPVPLPLTHVLAYGAEVLSALEYLHDHGLLHCDIKPDNIIHGQERLKLIDLGAARHMNDPAGPVWGSSGYQAREVVTIGPSAQSDLYSVGRTLAVLSLGTRVLSSDQLPEPDAAPLLMREESFRRFLCRATHLEPRRRFSSAPSGAAARDGLRRRAHRRHLRAAHSSRRRRFSARSRALPRRGVRAANAACASPPRPQGRWRFAASPSRRTPLPPVRPELGRALDRHRPRPWRAGSRHCRP